MASIIIAIHSEGVAFEFEKNDLSLSVNRGMGFDLIWTVG
jgi:hypothetical protein